MPLIEDKRAAAARLAGAAELRDIQVFRIAAELTKQPDSGLRLGYDLSTELAATQIDDQMVLAVEATTTLDMWQVPAEGEGHAAGGADDNEREEVASITLVMGTLYSVAGESFDFSDDETQAFAETTAHFAMFPFIRQQVHDLTSRLGLPPLVLPMLKIGLNPDEVSEALERRGAR